MNQLTMADVQAVLSLHQQGWSYRRIAQELGIHRDSVARYVREAEREAKPASEAPLLGETESKPASEAPPGSEGDAESKPAKAPPGSFEETSASLVAPAAEVCPVSAAIPSASAAPASRSACQPWAEAIAAKLDQGLSAQRIYQDLVSEHAFAGSYYSVRRFVGRLGQKRPLPFRRLECGPGEEVQVDFGAGPLLQLPEGKRRRSHVFRIVLSHSRKAYSEAVYRQTTDALIGCLENAFWSWGGLPQRVVLDNLRAAVQQADWFDPEVNPKMQSFAEHYGLALLPTRPYTPRHKGKIERGVGYVKDNALKGRVFASLVEVNDYLAEWERTVADTRVHGTTRQHVGKVFADVERGYLRPLPLERFPFFHEGQRSVHRDGHVEVDKAYYSVPPEYVTRRVWVRWDTRLVRVYNARLELIATHVKRAPGQFSTQRPHLAAAKISSVEKGSAWLLTKVQPLGPQAVRWAEAMLAARGIEGVRVLQGLLALGKRYAGAAIDRACGIAWSHGSYQLRPLRRLLQQQAAAPAVLPLMEEHPLIRPLSAYGQIAAEAFAAASCVAPGQGP